jgi:signal transduction histidine kinase
LGGFRNITERKQIETLNQQLQKSESLGQMAGGVAHHFNNKLQTVILSLELAKASPTQNPALIQSLQQAMRATHEAAEVSTLLLTYLGQSQVKYEPLDISDLCLAGLPLLRAAMPTDIDLVTDLPSPGPVISANANQIQQVLTRLMTNAWEAKGEGPNHLRLGIKTVTAADIPVTRRFPLDFQIQETAYACLEVVDAGSGIAAKDMGKLFDPFFSSKFAGRGLGLPVVLGIVRSHQGAITMESEPGRGSIFRVFFPVVADAVLPPRQAPVAAAG